MKSNRPLVLVDTSIWIDYFKSPISSAGEALSTLIEQERVALVGVVIAELLQGLRSEKEKKRLIKDFSVLNFISANREDWISTGLMLSNLKSRGITIPLTDAIIAQLCLRHGLLIFTNDKHFNNIPDLRKYSLKESVH